MNKIVLASVAMAMVSGAANAALISNGGKPQYSLIEIQAKVDSGEFYLYPFVAGKGIQSNEYLFGKTFKDGQVLPRVTDFVALQKAVAKSNTVLVADLHEEIILPCPEIFVELARQNGVSCYEFMEHYVTSTTDINSDAFGVHARAQTKAIIAALGGEEVTVNAPVLMEAGFTQAQVDDLVAAARSAEIKRLQPMIDSLTSENAALILEEAREEMRADAAEAMLATLTDERDDLRGDLAAVDAALNSFQPGNPAYQGLDRIGKINHLKNEVNTLRDRANAAAIANERNFDAIVEASGFDMYLEDFGPGSNPWGDLATHVAGLTTAEDLISDIVAAGQAVPYSAVPALLDIADTGDTVMQALEQTIDNPTAAQVAAAQLYIDAVAPIIANAKARALEGEIVVGRGASYNNALAGANTAQPGSLEGYRIMVTMNPDGITTGEGFAGFNAGTRILIDMNDNVPGWAYLLSPSLKVSAMSAMLAVQEAAKAAYNQGYRDGYDAGYNHGYTDGFRDGVNSVN